MKLVRISQNGEFVEENQPETLVVMNAKRDFVYMVKEGDHVSALRQKFGEILDNEVYVGQLLYIKGGNVEMYTVKPLDTLKLICDRYHVDSAQIRSKNNLTTDKLFVGQKLVIE